MCSRFQSFRSMHDRHRVIQCFSDLLCDQARDLGWDHKEDGIYTVQGCFEICRSCDLIANNSLFKITFIGMLGIDFVDLFLDISPETDFMAVIIEDL